MVERPACLWSSTAVFGGRENARGKNSWLFLPRAFFFPPECMCFVCLLVIVLEGSSSTFFFFFIYICYLSDMHFFFFLRGFWYVMWWSSSLQPPAGRNFVKTKKNSHFSTGFKQCRAIVSTYLITFHKQIPEKHARIPDLVFLFIKKTGKKKISQGKMLWSKVV